MALLVLLDTYNNDGVPPDGSILRKISYNRQRTRFHWANMRALPPRQRLTYYYRKSGGAMARELLRLSMKLSDIRVGIAQGNARRIFRPFLEDMNDRSGYAYKPRVYPGKVTVFRFQENFSFLADAQLGWGDVASGGVETVELPVCPGGMFVEPYVRTVAEKLQECLERAAG